MPREHENMERQAIAYSEKQNAIIQSAEKLFSQTGYDGTSVRDIAHQAGVNVAMISYYFGSKDKLMEAVFEQKTIQMRLKIENLLLNNQITHLEKINILIDDYVDKFVDQPEFHKIMMREQILEQNTPVAALIFELKKRNLSSIKKLIQEGQKSGEFKKHIDITLMMLTLVGTVSQLVISKRLYCEVNHLGDLSEPEYQKYIRKKLSTHLKNLFKITLTNDI